MRPFRFISAGFLVGIVAGMTLIGADSPISSSVIGAFRAARDTVLLRVSTTEVRTHRQETGDTPERAGTWGTPEQTAAADAAVPPPESEAAPAMLPDTVALRVSPSPPRNLLPVLGAQHEVVFAPGDFGLAELPDTHMSFVRTPAGYEVYVTAGKQSYRFEGPSLVHLEPVPSRGGSAIAVLKPGDGNDFDYTGLGSVLRLPDHAPGYRLGYFHAERYLRCGDQNFRGSIGLAQSHDAGRTWHILGEIAGPRPDAGCKGIQGAGQPSALFAENGYIYVYHTVWGLPGRADAIYVLRTPVASADVPGSYEIYQDGNWKPARSAVGSPVIQRPDSADFYTASPSISRNAAVGGFLGIVETRTGFGYTTSGDGLNWKPVRVLAIFPNAPQTQEAGRAWYSYPSLFDPNAPSDQVTGNDAYLYYAVGVRGKQPHGMVRQTFALDEGPLVPVTLPSGQPEWLLSSMVTSPREPNDVRTIALNRYFRPGTAPLRNDHWVTTRTPPAGYVRESQLGRIWARTSPPPQGQPLYDCYLSADDDHMVSVRSDCEGGSQLGVLGYISPVKLPNTLAIFRCYDRQSSNHLVSVNVDCEGLAQDGAGPARNQPLGYILAP